MKNYSNATLTFIIFLFLLSVSCKKEDQQALPNDNTEDTTTNDSTNVDEDTTNTDTSQTDSDIDSLIVSLEFTYVKGNNNLATTAQIQFSKIVGAKRYIFEFAKGNSGFGNIIKTKEILADTLDPFSTSDVPENVIYRTLFKGFEGDTEYAVRMKGVDTTRDLSSTYAETTFRTKAEQIFTGSEIHRNSILLTWEANTDVTKIKISDEFGTLIKEKSLTASEIDNAKALIDNLDPGVTYTFTIFNNNDSRGTLSLKTSGIKGVQVIDVLPGDNIADSIALFLNQGVTDFSLLFEGGKTYDLSGFDVPAGVKVLGFIGLPDDVTGALPIIQNIDMGVPDQAKGRLVFEQVEIQGNAGDYMIFIDGGEGVDLDAITFSHCNLSTYRAIMRIDDKTTRVGKISFNHCMINSTGSYGVVNVGKSETQVDTLSFKNSTLTEIGTQLMDVRNAISYIYIGHCTFYNKNSKMNYLLRFDGNHLPLSVVTEANIFSGSNTGNPVDVSYQDWSSLLDFSGNYITNDLQVGRDFPNISTYNGTAYDLFVDPDNKNFSIKTDAGFMGNGVAGDPRWY